MNFWTTIVLSLLVAGFYLLSRPEIGRLPVIGLQEIVEDKSLDLRFRMREPVKPHGDIVIITVMELSGREGVSNLDLTTLRSSVMAPTASGC